MRCPSVMSTETERLEALKQCGLSPQQPLPCLDSVVQIAAHGFGTPIAAVNMIGRDEVFFAASAGIGVCDMRRDVSFCAHAITQDDVLVVLDARFDARFHDNPLVTGDSHVRFYAGAPVRSPEGHALGALCIIDINPRATFSVADRARLKEMAKVVSDRLELRRLEVAAQESLQKFERMALISPNGIVCFERGGVVTAMNPAAEKIFGRPASEAIGQKLDLLLPAWKTSRIGRRLRRPDLETATQSENGEDLFGRRADGSDFLLEVAWSAWIDGEDANFGLVMRDVTDQRRQADELFRLAHFDHVTELPNLSLFQKRVDEGVHNELPAAMLVLGLSRYEDIKDTLGQGVGEAVLKQIASRLLGCVRASDVVGRLTGNVFAICLLGVGDPIRASEVATVAMAAVAQPILLEGVEVKLDCHVGIALCPSHSKTAEELVSNGNLALKEASKNGANQPFLFAPALRAQAVARRMFEAELNRAVEREELELYFQPQVRTSDQVLTGAEALLRWNHPERGLLSPAAFLPALEASSQANLVGTWIIDTACRQAAEWRKELDADFRMSINLFAAQLRSDGLRMIVSDAMDRHRLPGQAIKLEITETTALDDEALILPLLRNLREAGVQLAFDDFGTGFASLSLLTRYPLTHVKIDKSFVQKSFVSERDRAIVKAITNLAHELRLKVIAEGVESERYFQFCKEIGCDEVQGYYFGRPASAAQFTASWRQQPAGQAARA